MIACFVLMITHSKPFFLQAFSISPTVSSFLGVSPAFCFLTLGFDFVMIATVIGLFLRLKSCSVIYSLNLGICIYYSSSDFTSSIFFPILYLADKFHSFFSLKGNTLI